MLSEDDLENLRIVAAAAELAPDVPVTLRSFDAQVAEQLEAGVNVRRAYSASALAAPTFVAAVFGEEVVETLRLADAEIPLCRLRVDDASPLDGLSPHEMKERFGCAAVARAGPDGRWEPAMGDAGTIRTGDEILVGGLLLDVLRLALRNRGWNRRRIRPPMLAPLRNVPLPTPSWISKRWSPSNRWVPLAVVVLVLLVGFLVGLYAAELDLGPIDAAYGAVLTAFGNPSLSSAAGWVKVLGVTAMIAGAIVVGALLTHVTAIFTANRIEENAGRRARKLHDHVIVAGLGLVGFRVSRLLDELGVRSVVIERSSGGRFREAAAFHAPVLSGDASLPENLARAGVQHARCVVACTDNDLANVVTCVQARTLNPEARTVARVFDEDLSGRLGGFGIDAAISMSSVAAPAFVGAALDERAVRHIVVGDLELSGFRYLVPRDVPADEVAAWRGVGLRILSVAPPGGTAEPPIRAAAGLVAGSVMIVAGPDAVLRQHLT